MVARNLELLLELGLASLPFEPCDELDRTLQLQPVELIDGLPHAQLEACEFASDALRLLRLTWC